MSDNELAALSLLRLVQEHREHCHDEHCNVNLFPLRAVYQMLVSRPLTDAEDTLFR